MNTWRALTDELDFALHLVIAGLLVLVWQLSVYFISGRAKPHIRFHRLDDFTNNRVTFLIRNFDSVRYREALVVSLRSSTAIESVSVHGMPFCKTPMRCDSEGNILITFDKIPADATFSIEVKHKPADHVKLWLHDSSRLHPRNFDRKLEPFRGTHRIGYFLARWLIGLLGFIAVVGIGLALGSETDGGEKLDPVDLAFFAIAIPLALVVFVLVVPTGGKPIATGYLGWSGASNNWPPREGHPPSA